VQFEVETDEDSVEVDFNLEAITEIDFATDKNNPDMLRPNSFRHL
jgi:hypothetical protein